MSCIHRFVNVAVNPQVHLAHQLREVGGKGGRERVAYILFGNATVQWGMMAHHDAGAIEIKPLIGKASDKLAGKLDHHGFGFPMRNMTDAG